MKINKIKKIYIYSPISFDKSESDLIYNRVDIETCV